jgi:hypothetical protein
MPNYDAKTISVLVDGNPVTGLTGVVEVEEGGVSSHSRFASTGGGSGGIVRSPDACKPFPNRVRFATEGQNDPREMIQSWKEATSKGWGSTISIRDEVTEHHAFEGMLLLDDQIHHRKWAFSFADSRALINC